MIKKSFVTGILVLLPIVLTVAIVVFVFNLLTIPFLGIVKSVFTRYHLFENGLLFLTSAQFQNFIAKILILFSLMFITIALGMIGRWFFFHSFFKFTEYTVKKIPLVSSIYQTCQDVTQTIFTAKNQAFKQVVLVHFPHSNSYSLGLITREDLKGLQQTPYEKAVAVFVPTTPNPTSGFLVLYKPENVVYLDMKVEDAFKYIISCGVILPPFNVITKEEALLRQINNRMSS